MLEYDILDNVEINESICYANMMKRAGAAREPNFEA